MDIFLNGTEAGMGYSQLSANGLIDVGGSTLNLSFGFAPPLGSSFQIVTNMGSAPISGIFNGLPEGNIFMQGGYQFEITYHGGTGGNSVVVMRLASRREFLERAHHYGSWP